MAKSWRRTLAALAVGLMLTGCAHVIAYNQAVDAEKNGNFVISATKTVEAVENNHDYPEARQLWSRIWPKAKAAALLQIATDETSNDWEQAVEHLNTLNGIVLRARALQLDASIEPLNDRLANATMRAAEMLYQRGMDAEQHGKLREAAISFQRATHYVPTFRDAEARYNKNRAAAMVRVAVLPFDTTSYYQSAGEILGDRMLQELLNKQGEFLTFVDRQYLNTIIKEASLQASGLVDASTAIKLGKLSGIRYLVAGRVSQVSATTPQQTREQYSASRVILDGNFQRQVNATYIKSCEVREVVVTASVQIIDLVDGTVAKAWTDSERATDTAEGVSNVVGDLRALDANLQSLYYRTPIPKSHDVLLDEATKRLSQTFAGRVASYLN